MTCHANSWTTTAFVNFTLHYYSVTKFVLFIFVRRCQVVGDDVSDVRLKLAQTYSDATLDDLRDVIDSAARLKAMNDLNKLVESCEDIF